MTETKEFYLLNNDILRFVKYNFLWYYRHYKKTRNL